MDGLISMLIIFGIFSLFSSNKKKKAQKKHMEKARGFMEAAETALEEKAPFSMDEWKDYLKQQPASGHAAPAVRKMAEEKVKTAVQNAEIKPAKVRPVKAAKPQPALQHDDPEGSISTQGETPEEHAEHRRKILAEEEKRHQEHAARQELRDMNLKKLRSAVVMSEVLGKPVSLRPRGYR